MTDERADKIAKLAGEVFDMHRVIEHRNMMNTWNMTPAEMRREFIATEVMRAELMDKQRELRKLQEEPPA